MRFAWAALRLTRFEVDCESFHDRTGEPEMTGHLAYPIASFAFRMEFLNAAPDQRRFQIQIRAGGAEPRVLWYSFLHGDLERRKVQRMGTCTVKPPVPFPAIALHTTVEINCSKDVFAACRRDQGRLEWIGNAQGLQMENLFVATSRTTERMEYSGADFALPAGVQSTQRSSPSSRRYGFTVK